MKHHTTILWSPGFLLALILLLINDHWLKYEFNNFITGKLSDIAGLFIFPLFFSAFLPKYKRLVYWITAVGFIWWKSPLSNDIIQLWNQLGLFAVQRVIDYTDLFTLLILPLSYWYFNLPKQYSLKLNPTPVIIISSFAFMATSRAREEVKVNKSYEFNYSLDTLQHRLFFHPNLQNGLREDWYYRDSLEKVSIDYQHPDSIKEKNKLIEQYFKYRNHLTTDTTCSQGIWIDIEIAGNKTKSGLWLNEIWHYCHDKRKEIEPKLLKIFESTIIPYLKK